MRNKLLRKVAAVSMAMCMMLTACGGNNTGVAGSTNTDHQTASAPETGSSAEIADEGAEKVYASSKEWDELGEIYHAALPTEAQECEVYIDKIDGLSEDFYRVMDISSVLAQEASGVKYYDENGNETDLFRILADYGINMIRVRVWNDPYDAEGNGYGGGNCDAAVAAEIGRRAAQNGMKLLVDFHYSDFWADPSKQMCPKAWEGMTVEQKAEALYDYTMQSLTDIYASGSDIAIVQVGNETNFGVAGETEDTAVTDLLGSGARAVRAFSNANGLDIKVAVHFTNVDDANGMLGKAAWMKRGGVDYDIFGISYYTYWHGTIDNMVSVLKDIKANYGKETMILETSYPFTDADGDDSGNSVSGKNMNTEWPVSPQGQAMAVADVIAAAVSAGAIGVAYWEGAWTPVGNSTTHNSPIWEKYGSGWATSYAAEYDPDDAGLYYGGSSWDNQAFFDKKGNVLPSLNVFRYIYTGTITEPEILYYGDCEIVVPIGKELVLPEGIPAVYNNRSLNCDVPVTWETDGADIDTSVGGTYKIKGMLEDGTEVVCTVTVEYVNLIQNPSFENKNDKSWTVSSSVKDTTDIQTKAADAKSGDNALHWWDKNEQDFDVTQTLTAPSDGLYGFTGMLQGGDVGAKADIYLYVIVGDEKICSEPVKLDGWVKWKNPVIENIELEAGDPVTIGIHVSCAGGGWGTMDDFQFYIQ